MPWTAGYHDHTTRTTYDAEHWGRARRWLVDELDRQALAIEAGDSTLDRDVHAELVGARDEVAALPPGLRVAGHAGPVTYWLRPGMDDEDDDEVGGEVAGAALADRVAEAIARHMLRAHR